MIFTIHGLRGDNGESDTVVREIVSHLKKIGLDVDMIPMDLEEDPAHADALLALRDRRFPIVFSTELQKVVF